MRIPQQVSERVKEAPAQALRAVFSGIGQVLLVADRIKSRAAEPERAPAAPATPSVPAEPAPQSSATTVKDETRWRSLDETGNVRLIPGEDTSKATPTTTPPAPETPDGSEVIEVSEVAEISEVSEATEAASTVVPEPPVTSEPAAVTEQTSTQSPVTPEAPATSLPLPNYDNLTVPSLRARLRNLDPAQLRTLVDYEKAHAGRADVLTMFERRIAKLESDGA
jgi:cytoskeletal protein RodZ